MLLAIALPTAKSSEEKPGGMNGKRIGLWMTVVGALALYPAIRFQEGVSTTLPEYVLLYATVLVLGFGVAIWGLSVLRTLTTDWTT